MTNPLLSPGKPALDVSHFTEAPPLAGDRSLSVDVFGLRIRFDGLTAAVENAGRAQYAAFLSEAPPSHAVSVRRGATAYLPIPADKFMSLEMESRAEGTLMVSNFFAALRTPESGILLVSDADRADSVLGAMENYLRWMVSETVVRRNCVVLHSAGIVRNGKAYVFFGHSGAGKSTVAELSAPMPVLSDDLVLLRKQPDGWHACSTPFAGTFPQHRKEGGVYPLAGLYLLRKSETNSAQPVALPVAVGMLVAAAPFLTDTDRTAHLVPLLQDLCRNVPVFELRFRKDPSFWNVV